MRLITIRLSFEVGLLRAAPFQNRPMPLISPSTRRSRSSSELREAREHLAYFRKWTFDNPANFRLELMHLVTGNSGEERQRFALSALQPRFHGNVRARIVSLMVEAWEVPIAKALEIYNGLPGDQQAKLNEIVDEVIAEARADLPNEILYSDLPLDEWKRVIQNIYDREARAVKTSPVQSETNPSLDSSGL